MDDSAYLYFQKRLQDCARRRGNELKYKRMELILSLTKLPKKVIECVIKEMENKKMVKQIDRNNYIIYQKKNPIEKLNLIQYRVGMF